MPVQRPVLTETFATARRLRSCTPSNVHSWRKNMKFTTSFLSFLLTFFFVAAVTCAPAVAQQQQRPNIVVIWGDDIGQSNVSAYSRGMMGYQTPNIDRLAGEGMMFTDYYAEQ